MNALDKTKNVRKALECCRGEWDVFRCSECPYDDKADCMDTLYKDALEVIDGFKAELKKRATKSSSKELAFITLTVVKGGEKDEKIAIKVDDILLISNASNGFGGRSIIYMNPIDGSEGLVFFVKETLEDILEKISKGE